MHARQRLPPHGRNICISGGGSREGGRQRKHNVDGRAADGSAKKTRIKLPCTLGFATTWATTETLHAAALTAGLVCERNAKHDRVILTFSTDAHLDPVPVHRRFSSALRAALVLRPTETGWEAIAWGLRLPPGIESSVGGHLCSGLGSNLCFDRRDVLLSYRPSGRCVWQMYDLLLDIQSSQSVRSVVNCFADLRTDMPADTWLRSANCCELHLIVFAIRYFKLGKRHIKLEWYGGASAAQLPSSAWPLGATPPAQPGLQLRLRIDYLTNSILHEHALALIDSGALDEIVNSR